MHFLSLLLALLLLQLSPQHLSIEGPSQMTFGPTPDTPAPNAYKLVVKDENGSPMSEDEVRSTYGNFRVHWNVMGFKTENDQTDQYCDSYGKFVTNDAASLATTFELRNVPMNFYGLLTATLSIEGKELMAEKGVVALGNDHQEDTQVLPVGGYPKAFNGYDEHLVGTSVKSESHGQAQDPLFGRWIAAGSDSKAGATLCRDDDGTQYIRFAAWTEKKSHVFAHSFTPPTSVMVFSSKVRFHHPGAVMTLTSRFPFWSSAKIYTNPVTLLFDGHNILLNGTPLVQQGKPADFATGQWYDVTLTIDKRTETCLASVADTQGTSLGQSDTLKWKETSKPDFFSIGFNNESTGIIEIAECEVIAPNAGAERYNAPVEKGNIYQVEVTYQGVLTTGYVNSDLAGFTLGSHEGMATDTFRIACPRDVLDLRIGADATGVAKIAEVKLTKLPKPQRRAKPKVFHIGDSTSANKGSWAWSLVNMLQDSYPELAALCDFDNRGAGGRNLSTYYQQGRLAPVLLDICPGDIVMFGNNGTNGMNSTFEEDVNYYLDAAEAMGARTIINSYTPHGAVSRYSNGYDAENNRFESYRRDPYDVIVRKVAAQRAATDSHFLGFVEIGQNADAIFNAYVEDYAANGFSSKEAAAQAIIACFSDHNHYSKDPLACELMLSGYKTCSTPGIVAQLISLLSRASGPAK